MFDFASVFLIATATGVVTNQVTKHGWKGFLDSMIDHDETKPKHYRRDNGIDQVMSSKFPETLKGSDKNGRTNRTIHNA